MFMLTLLVTVVFLFLGPLPTLTRPNSDVSTKVEMPDLCHGKNYCFLKHNNYPDKLIETLLDDLPDLWFEDNKNDVGQRNGKDEQNDCEVKTMVDPIHQIIDEQGHTRYVVQSDKRFMQLLKIEECVKPGRLNGSSLHFTSTDLENNVLTCEEKRIDFSFLVLTPDFKGVELAKAKNGIPICCSCVYHES